MEGNLLFNHVLRAAGFVAYTAGVRIRSRVEGVPVGREYTGWYVICISLFFTLSHSASTHLYRSTFIPSHFLSSSIDALFEPSVCSV